MSWNNTLKRKPIDWVKTESGCFECISHALDDKGYPMIQRNKIQTRIHRYIYETLFGLIPKGMCVCHSCDNRKCINPEHLWLGTIADNNKDMYNKGRNSNGDQKGESNSRSKLTNKQVLAIREDTRPRRVIAKEYHVSISSIDKIKTKETWSHI
jgi:hypothetical protein